MNYYAWSVQQSKLTMTINCAKSICNHCVLLYLGVIFPIIRLSCSYWQQSGNHRTHHKQHEQINGLVQERRNSSAKAMELRLSCNNPSKWAFISAEICTYVQNKIFWYSTWYFNMVRNTHHNSIKCQKLPQNSIFVLRKGQIGYPNVTAGIESGQLLKL